MSKEQIKAIPVQEWEREAVNGTVILDIREAGDFIRGFIPESINIEQGKLAKYIGNILNEEDRLILVGEKGVPADVISQLQSSGFRNIAGYLEGGFAAWQQAGKTIDMIISIEADEYAMDQQFDNNLMLIDVREEGEYNEAHIKGAVSMPLDTFQDVLQIASVDDEKNIYIHCGGGSRSMIVASLFKKQGIHNLRIVEGGFGAMKQVPGAQVVTGKKEE